MNEEFKKRHDYFIDALNRLPGIVALPGAGTFYALADCQRRHDGASAARTITRSPRCCSTRRASPWCRARGFGAPGHFRASFACSMADARESHRAHEEGARARAGREDRLTDARWTMNTAVPQARHARRHRGVDAGRGGARPHHRAAPAVGAARGPARLQARRRAHAVAAAARARPRWLRACWPSR